MENSLEEDRISVLKKKKKKNGNAIKMMMRKTFGYKRQEIVDKQPRIEDVAERYPALFQVDEVSQEMEASGALQHATMAMAVFSENEDLSYPPRDIGVIIEGVKVLSALPTIPMAFIILLGLIYTLNLQYPKEFRFTFEVAQKILMGLSKKQMTARVRKLHSALPSASETV